MTELFEKKLEFVRKNISCLETPTNKYNSVKEMLFADFLVKYNYESTAIEGSQLNKMQHYSMLYKGICPTVGTMQPIYESLNHADAFKYLLKQCERSTSLAAPLIAELHSILMNHLLNAPGEYRTVNVAVRSARHSFPEWGEVIYLMQEFFVQYEEKKGVLQPLELAAWVHSELVSIHPYVDGNGRMSRLMMNYVLLQHQYLPVSIPVEEKEAYFNFLDEYYRKRDFTQFEKYLAILEEKQLDSVIKFMEPYIFPFETTFEDIEKKHPDNSLEVWNKLIDSYNQEVKKRRGF